MSKKPGLYHDIGNKARDLLYKDYCQQLPIHFHDLCFDWSFKFSCQIHEPVPGFGALFNFFIPYQRSNRVELQYLGNYAGFAAGTSLAMNPQVDLSGVLGSSFFCIGSNITFDTMRREFTKYNAGLSFNSAIFSASLTLNDNFDICNASWYRCINPMTKTAAAAELAHRFSTGETTVTLGMQHDLTPATLARARVGTNGNVGALIQQKLLSTFFLTLAAEVDIKHILRSAKFGMSVKIQH